MRRPVLWPDYSVQDIAVERGERLTANPSPGFALACGGVLSVLGTQDQRAAFSSLMRS
jgi:K+/H+ antiporter YhaU regulatory subunit KhtT